MTADSNRTDPAPAPARLKSAGALAFNDANVLFVGDSKAGVVHAFDFEEGGFDDQADYQLGRAETFEGRTLINGLDHELAALMGVPASAVVINDLRVHKPTGQIVLSVHRGRGPNATPTIFKVDRGRLTLLDLDAATHTQMSVGPVHAPHETLEFGQRLNSLAITHIEHHDGELFVAGIANETFSSKLRRLPYPFTGAPSVSSIEIWHAVHAQYETRAPIITHTVTELDGVPTLIAVYACTPIVKIPLSALRDGAVVRGTMIGELGFGNTPIDLITYVNSWDQSRNALITNTNRSAVSIPLDALAAAEPMPHGDGVKPFFSVGGVAQYPMPLGGTLHLDTIDDTWAIVVRRGPEDPKNIQLHTLPMPFFFDRSDHAVEMNWSDGPDPFGYKSAPPIRFA